MNLTMKISESILIDVAMCIVLVCLSIEDFRHRSISVVRLVIIAMMAVGYRILTGFGESSMIIAEIIFLTSLIIYSHISGSIGMADAIVIGFICMMKGMEFAVGAIVISMAVLLLYAVVMFVAGRIKATYSVPYIPYLLIGVCGVMLCV